MSDSEIIDELLADARERMAKSVESTRQEFGSVRTGRATPALLDGLGRLLRRGDAAQAAGDDHRPGAADAHRAAVDQSSIKAIERAILESDIGLTPGNDGKIIRLVVPELTEERRRQLVKVVRNIAEDGRIAIRNVRRDVMQDLRELKEAGETGSDDEHRAEVELQKVTDSSISDLDDLLKHKEDDILEV